MTRLRIARWRAAVRRALRATDGVAGSPAERRLVDAYDRLVAAERHR